MTVYFFYGDEDYNIELQINELKEKLLDKNFSSMSYKCVDNPQYTDLISYLRTQPMMFGNQMLVINCENYFSQAFEDYQLSEIETALKDNIESLCIIFVCILPRGEGKKPDSRRKFYKILTKYAKCQEFPTFKNYETDKLYAFIKNAAKKQKLTIENDACLELITRVGSNLRELVKEIEKLQLLAYPKNNITKDMVKDISISNEDLFALTDSLMKQNKGNAILEFRKLLDKKHPLEIISALQTMLRKWILTKLYKSQGQSIMTIAKATGQKEFLVEKILKNLENITIKDLVDLRQKITDAEYKMKNGESIDAIDEFEIAIL